MTEPTASIPQPNQPPTPSQGVPPADFPPQEIGAFLRFCAGEWMGLRSRFALDAGLEGENGDEWHSSERGELVVTYIEPGTDPVVGAGGGAGAADSPGGLSLGPKGGAPRQLLFASDGSFLVAGQLARGQHQPEQQGTWQLWPDGSLELTLCAGDTAVTERIWFTKPNLRLRSTVENRADGMPGRASFSSEIRRLSRPAG